MLVGLIGGDGAGKKTLMGELVREHGFRELRMGKAGPEAADTTTTTGSGSSGSTNRPFSFRSPQDLLRFATANWTQDFVTIHLNNHARIRPFIKRPFFVLVYLHAPLSDRWARIRSLASSPLSFEEFVRQDDKAEFGEKRETESEEEKEEEEEVTTVTGGTIGLTRKLEGNETEEEGGMMRLKQLASYWITNNGSLPALLTSLAQVHLPKMRQTMRPSWDTYFTELANLASLRSNCMKRRVGAVLVSLDKRVLSTGYNGTPRGMLNCNEGGCSRCNGRDYTTSSSSGLDKMTSVQMAGCGENLEECLCLHAEENALLEAGRDRITNSTLYCNTCPCLRCSIKIVQCGVKEVVYSLSYSMDEQTKKIFIEAGIKLRQFTSL
ncbi:hypothetical protein VP01_416g11 [Puccinia sorghi]|uniref:Deoxycytidylate deaminase n=1 Tax=Puccinia sorghi TaxID=27349 RepID=A0A0L6UQX8_9BASI|nr:hypothetical protein VP01_416g11 [Puccinia sorghi]